MRTFATLIACFGLATAAGCTNEQPNDETEAPVTGKTAEPGVLDTDTERETTEPTVMPESDMQMDDTTRPEGMDPEMDMEDPRAMTPPRAGQTGSTRTAEVQPGSADPVARLAIIEIQIEKLQGTAPKSELSRLERDRKQAEQRVRTAEKAVNDLEQAVQRAESKAQQQKGTQPQRTQPQGTQPKPEPGMQQGGTTPQPEPGMQQGGTTPQPEPGMQQGGTTPQPEPGMQQGGTTPQPEPDTQGGY